MRIPPRDDPHAADQISGAEFDIDDRARVGHNVVTDLRTVANDVAADLLLLAAVHQHGEGGIRALGIGVLSNLRRDRKADVGWVSHVWPRQHPPVLTLPARLAKLEVQPRQRDDIARFVGRHTLLDDIAKRLPAGALESDRSEAVSEVALVLDVERRNGNRR